MNIRTSLLPPCLRSLQAALFTGISIALLLLVGCSHTGSNRGAEKERPYTTNIPPGTWKVGEIYELKKRAYIRDDSYIGLDRPEEYTGLAKYESNPDESKTLVGVLEAGTRYRVIDIQQNSGASSPAPFVYIIGIVLNGPFKNLEVFVANFSDKSFIDGEFGLLFPPDLDRVKRIQ